MYIAKARQAAQNGAGAAGAAGALSQFSDQFNRCAKRRGTAAARWRRGGGDGACAHLLASALHCELDAHRAMHLVQCLLHRLLCMNIASFAKIKNVMIMNPELSVIDSQKHRLSK